MVSAWLMTCGLRTLPIKYTEDMAAYYIAGERQAAQCSVGGCSCMMALAPARMLPLSAVHEGVELRMNVCMDG